MPKQVLFVFGGPGAGKSTQCQRLEQTLGWKHLCVGDLLRNEKASGTVQAQLIAQCIDKGILVPSGTTVDLLKKAIEKSTHTHFLIDGFPRSLQNLHAWEQQISHNVHVLGCLHFECSDDAMLSRVLARAATSGRSDDTTETCRNRIT
eukprot:3937848-Rhodomonas_salina.4